MKKSIVKKEMRTLEQIGGKDLKASEIRQEKFLLTQGLKEKRRTKYVSEWEKRRKKMQSMEKGTEKIK